MITWLDGQVVDVKLWHDELVSLKIATEKLNFIAGQFTIIGLEHEGNIIHRPYSLVNSPEDDYLEVHYNLVNQGELTPLLHNLHVGDSILVSSKPSGLLTLDEVPNVPHLWLFATGTGIGPFISILNTNEPWQRFEKITVAYSVKTIDDLAYKDTFESLSREHPDKFTFIPTVTRQEIPGIVNCRITKLIENGESERLANTAFSKADSHIMLCGNANMLDDVTLLLEQRGLSRHSRREPGNIAIEKYY